MRFGWRSPGAGATSSALVALAALGVAVQISDVPAVDRAAKSWVAHHSFDGLAAALVPLTWISGWLPVALALGGVGLVLSLHRHTICPAIVKPLEMRIDVVGGTAGAPLGAAAPLGDSTPWYLSVPVGSTAERTDCRSIAACRSV